MAANTANKNINPPTTPPAIAPALCEERDVVSSAWETGVVDCDAEDVEELEEPEDATDLVAVPGKSDPPFQLKDVLLDCEEDADADDEELDGMASEVSVGGGIKMR